VVGPGDGANQLNPEINKHCLALAGTTQGDRQKKQEDGYGENEKLVRHQGVQDFHGSA
jgi:hypothetical protein